MPADSQNLQRPFHKVVYDQNLVRPFRYLCIHLHIHIHIIYIYIHIYTFQLTRKICSGHFIRSFTTRIWCKHLEIYVYIYVCVRVLYIHVDV